MNFSWGYHTSRHTIFLPLLDDLSSSFPFKVYDKSIHSALFQCRDFHNITCHHIFFKHDFYYRISIMMILL